MVLTNCSFQVLVPTAGFINNVRIGHNLPILRILFVISSWNLISQCQLLGHTMYAKSKTWKLQ